MIEFSGDNFDVCKSHILKHYYNNTLVESTLPVPHASICSKGISVFMNKSSNKCVSVEYQSSDAFRLSMLKSLI